MRKIWWLPVICIAACVAQAIIAADYQGSATRKSPASGRSRLLIYSRNKTPDPALEADEEEEAPRPASGRLSRSKLEDDAAPVTRKPSGDTGTISPKSALAKGAARSAAARSASTTGKARLDDLVEEEASEPESSDSSDIDDEEIRQMFEDETAVAPRVAKRPVARPSIRRTEELEADVTGSRDLSEVEPLDPQTRKAARYKELLGTSATDSDRPASATSKAAQKKIVPVSSEYQGQEDLEINPFEPSERPTKVVNAGFEEEKGNTGSRRVRPASSTVATKSTAAEKADKSEKSTAVKAPSAKPLAVKTASVVKPTETSKSSPSVKTTESGKVWELTRAPVKNKTPKESTEADTSKSSTSVATISNQSPQVDVQWEPRGEVTLGQECQCALVVHNSGKVAAREVIVEANFPESVRLVDAKPFPKETSQRLEWQFGSLAAGEKKVIELTMVPTKRGEFATSAQVRFTGTAATSFQVSEPLLTATLKLTEEVHVGEPASATVTVSNPGTGTAQNVVVETVLPKGLSSTSGKEVITELGPIGAGETRTIRFPLIATAGGDHNLKVIARSSTADLEQTASAKITVLAPSLTLKATGPSLRYVNRTAKYVLTVTNSSNAASDNVRISQTVVPGFDFVKADHGGQWDSQRRAVNWFLGHLDAGKSTTVELDLMPKETGEFKQQFRVVGDSGAQASAEVATRVDGAASLVMEVKDGDDPVEVGSETVFEVRVRNDGSKSAHKVAISLELPPDVDFVNVDGPTQHLFESGMLIFKPLADLKAGDSATFKVFVKGTAAGTTKLRARLTSESIQKPLIVEEATQFYED